MKLFTAARHVLIVGSVSAGLIATPGPAAAITHCKAKVLTDGTIAISGRDVVGTAVWGIRYGQEVTGFDNAGACVAAGKARNCALAAVGMPARTTPPASCTIFVADDGAESCSAWVKRCYASSEPPPCPV